MSAPLWTHEHVQLAAHLDVLHEAVALPAAGQGLPRGSDGGEGDLHQLVHACRSNSPSSVQSSVSPNDQNQTVRNESTSTTWFYQNKHSGSSASNCIFKKFIQNIGFVFAF